MKNCQIHWEIIPRSSATDVPDTCRFDYTLSIVKSFNSTPPMCHFIVHLQPRAEGYLLFDVRSPETFNLNTKKLLNDAFEAWTHIDKIELINVQFQFTTRTFSMIFDDFNCSSVSPYRRWKRKRKRRFHYPDETERDEGKGGCCYSTEQDTEDKFRGRNEETS